MRTMRTIRLLAVLAVVAGLAVGAAAAPAQATCEPGRISIKPLVVQLPNCQPPDGGGPIGG